MRNFNLRTIALLLGLLCCLGPALAEDRILLKATNDQDSTVDELSLRVDGDGKLTHFLHVPSGRDQLAYTPSELKRGIVLRRKSGRDLVKLKMTKFSPERGASVLLTYLYSAVPMESYRSLKLKLVKKKGEWVLQDSKGGTIASMHIKANMANVLGYRKAVGIEKLVLKKK